MEKFEIMVTRLGECAEKSFVEIYKQWKGRITVAVGKSGTVEALENLVRLKLRR